MSAIATHVYWGHRDAMIAEVSTPDYYEGKYLVQVYGDADWDAEGFSNKRDAEKHARYVAESLTRKQGTSVSMRRID